jgi:hypothetical protein
MLHLGWDTLYKPIFSEGRIGGKWFHFNSATKWNASRVEAAVIILGNGPTLGLREVIDAQVQVG